MNSNDVNLFFAVDNNYFPYLGVTLESIYTNANKDRTYHIYVMNTGISEEYVNRLKKHLPSNFIFHNVDIREKISNVNLFTRDYYSKTTYFRLFIPDMFPELDKALYLDSDIIVLDDVAKLYDENMGENLVGAIPDSAVQNIIPFQQYVEECLGVKYNKYFNAGILLMNLKKLREFDFENKFLKLISTYKFHVAQDQDYLNVICKDKVHYIDYAWNTMPIKNNVVKTDNIKLIHFNMLWKPWIFNKTLYEDYFWNVANNSEFSQEIQNIKNSYSKEKIEECLAGEKKLVEACISEANNPNNFKKLFLK